MNELACIQAFVSIVETGSQLLAAKKLHQTNAAINKKLAKLEAKLGIQLLERDNKSSKLTPKGKHYYAAYKEVLEKLTDIEQIASLDKATPKGRLMVTMSRSIANGFIVPHVKSFLKKYPELFLVMDIAEKTADYIPGRQDILIAPDVMLHENLVRKKLISTRDILCASPVYLKKHGQPKKLSDLQQLDYVGHCTRAPVNTIDLGNGKSIEISKPLLRVNDDATAISLALRHLGFIYIKQYQVINELTSGRLIEILPKLNKNQTNIAMHYHYQQYIPPKIKVFIDYFVSKNDS
jgi:DNA-binding transcriptional LysR family regulator